MNNRHSTRVPFRGALTVLAVVAASLFPGLLHAQEEPNFAKWEKEIAKLEDQDKEMLPEENGIVFVGSSTIRLWDLKKSFPDLDPINRGFGGSQLADSVHFAPRIVLKYKPRTVVLYAGDNDLAAGKTPEQVAADFREFVRLMHRVLPKTRIVFLSIKPSVKRWNIWDKVKKTNARIEFLCDHDSRCSYVDDSKVILGPDGKPQADLFQKDGLHLNEKGYELISQIVRPYLK
jgi:lysophospholipase L1-like esterase